MSVRESQDSPVPPEKREPSPPPPSDPAPKREFGTVRGQLSVPDEFFDPLPPDELASWEGYIGRYNPPYRIDAEGGDWVVRIRADVIGLDSLLRFLDFLTITAIQQKSALSDEKAAELASGINRVVADRLRSRLRESSS